MLPMITLIFGRWTKCIFNNMVPDVECGFRPSVKTPLRCTIQHEKVSAILEP